MKLTTVAAFDNEDYPFREYRFAHLTIDPGEDTVHLRGYQEPGPGYSFYLTPTLPGSVYLSLLRTLVEPAAVVCYLSRVGSDLLDGALDKVEEVVHLTTEQEGDSIYSGGKPRKGNT